MLRKFLVVLLVVLVVPSLVYSQGEVNKRGTTAANFLKLEVGARAIGLAGAFTTLADNGTAMHYNPAGLADMVKMGFTYHNMDLYVDMRQQFIGFVVPFGDANTIGFYLNYLDMGFIERTTINSPNGTLQPVFGNSTAYGVVFSRRLTDRVLFGVGVKYAIEKLWNDSAVGVSFDFGAIYEPGVGGLRLGMVIKHLGPEMRMDRGPAVTFMRDPKETYPGNRRIPSKYIVDKFPMPTVFKLGMTFDLLGPTSVVMANDVHRLSMVSELNDSFDASVRTIYGLEYEWNEMLSLRGGLRKNYDLFRYSFGGGFKIPIRNSEVLFDYAYADYGDLEGVYVTSLEIRF